MRVVFLGTPEFAVPSLRALLASRHEVCAVVTQPDRASGRGQRPQPPPVKQVAVQAGVPVHQPAKIRDEENRALLERLEPDFFVVVAYGQILPGWLLKIARIAPVNVHASLLPKYRGAAPVIWAILRGETTTGVTTMLMAEQLDTGDILMVRECPIDENVTGGELAARLASIGAGMLVPTLEGLALGTTVPLAQDHDQASWAPRLTKEQAWIAWENDARTIHNHIRGLNPWPVARTNFQGQAVQVLCSQVRPDVAGEGFPPGTFLGRTQRGMLVQCGQGGIIEVLEVKLANRRRVSGMEFSVGARLEQGTRVFVSTPAEQE